MLNHPQNAQAIIAQRWTETQANVARERRGQAAQPPRDHWRGRLPSAFSWLARVQPSRGGLRLRAARRVAARYATIP